jgi:zinc transport system permease protein
LNYLLLSILAVTIVAAMKLVGIVLVSAFLVIPAATGQTLASSVRGMVVFSVAAALLSVGAGLWLSWLWSLPSGAAIVLFSAVLFFASYLFNTARSRG